VVPDEFEEVVPNDLGKTISTSLKPKVLHSPSFNIAKNSGTS